MFLWIYTISGVTVFELGKFFIGFKTLQITLRLTTTWPTPFYL